LLQFSDSSSAGSATITNSGSTDYKGGAGAAQFFGTSTAANATITNQATGQSRGVSGFVAFNGASTAGNATISNNGGAASQAENSATLFNGGSTAGGATINNNAATASNSNSFGSTHFFNSSSAGTASINNNAGIGGAGSTLFFDSSTAANAIIINKASSSTSNGGGVTLFQDNSSAGTASITNAGATVNGALGGSTTFTGNSSAGSAELINNPGSNGGQGGTTYFEGSADGGTARAINNAGALFDISLLNGGMHIGSIEGAGTYNLGSNTLTIVGDGFSTTVSGIIQGAGGSLVLASSNSLTLLGQNTYTGTTGIVNSSTLNANSALSTSTAVVMDNTGPGFSTLNLGANQSIASLTGAASSTVNLNGNTLTVGNSGPTTFAGVIADGTGSGGLTMNGSGTFILSGQNTYTGATTVNSGVLQIGNGISGNINSANAVTVNTGLAIDLANGSVFGASVNLIGVNSQFGVSLNANTINTVSGAINGSGNLLETGGTTILTGANTYTGITQISANGALQIGTAGTAASIAPGSSVSLLSGTLTLVNLAGGTFANNVTAVVSPDALNINSASTITISGALTEQFGSLTVTKSGPGTAIISGTSNTYAAATTVNGGILEVDGSLGATTVTVNKQAALSGMGTLGGNVFIESGASLEAGGSTFPGTLTIAGNLTTAAGATSIFRLGAPGTNDTIDITGSLRVQTTFSLVPLAGFGPGTYTLFTYGGNDSTVSLINPGSEIPGYHFAFSLSPGEVQIVVTLPGGGAEQDWNATAGGSPTGGSGTWDTTSSIWSNPGNGNTTTHWLNGIADFGVTGGTVTIPASTTITAQGLIFDVDGYNISGADTKSALKLSTLAPTITVNTGTATINVPVSGSAGLIANGAGTLVLANTGNSLSGNVTVVTGTLQIGTASADGSIGASAKVILDNGATLTLMNALNDTVPNSITAGLGQNGTVNFASPNTTIVSGALTDGSPGQLFLNQSGTGLTVLINSKNTNSGQTTISAGTLQIGTQTAGSLGPSSLVNFTGNGTLSLVDVSGNVFPNSVTVSAPTFASVTAQSKTSLTISGALSTGIGGLQFFQNGPGTVILSGNNSIFSTAVNSGTLQVGDGTTTWTDLETDGNAVQVNTGATLATNLAGGAIFTDNVSLNTNTSSLNSMQSGTNTLTGVISGTGKLSQTGTGRTILVNAAETNTGPTSITAGSLQIGNGQVGSYAGGLVTMSGNGALALDLPTNSTFSPNVTLSEPQNSVQTIQPGFLILSSVISGHGSLDQSGTGFTQIPNGVTEAYTGPTNVSAGTLDVEGSLAKVSTVNVTGGTLTGGGTINGNVILSGNATIALYTPGEILGTLNVNATGGSWTGYALVNGPVTVSTFSDNSFNLGLNATLIAPAGLTVQAGTISATNSGSILEGSLTYTSVTNSTFSGIIADGAKPSTLTMNKAGSTLVLNGVNTYSGATTVTAGTLQIGDGTLGSINPASPVTVATVATLALDLYDSADFLNPVALTGTLKAIQSGTIELSVPITGTGTFVQNGTGTTILSATEQYSGATNVTTGTLELDGTLPATTTLNVGTAGTLTGSGLAGNATLTGNGIINFSTGGIGGTLAVTGGTWAGQGSVAKAVTSSSGVFTISGNLTATSGLNVTGGTIAGNGTLTGNLNYTSSAFSNFPGVIANGSAPSTLTMNKANSVLILTGANTYTGATTVSAGALLIASPGSLGDTPVTVSGSGILGGSGTINGVETINSGGTLSPSGIGTGTPTTFTVGSLILNTGANVHYQLGAAGAGTTVGANDFTVVDGNLTLNSGATLDITPLMGFGVGTYQLFSYTGTLTGSTLKLGPLPTGFTAADFSFQSGGGQVDLVVSNSPTNAQYWNGAGSAGINGGSGTWDNSTTNWTNSAGTTSAAWTGATGIFSAGSGTVTVGANVSAASFGFVPGAGAYTINVNPTFTLTISGTGLSNTSGTTQNLATLTNSSGQAGTIAFTNGASAGNVTITNNGATGTAGSGGSTTFANTATASTATIINQGSAVASARSGSTTFSNTSTANNASITNQGGTSSNASGGVTTFFGSASAGNAVITNEAGTNGGFEGDTFFIGTPNGGTAQLINNGGGHFDMSGVTSSSGFTVGSISGAGVFFLGGKPFTVGGNDLSTTVTGILEDGGQLNGTGASLFKTGTGTLTLTGANTYSGATTVSAGTLQIGDGNTGAAALAASSVVTVNGSTSTLAIDLKGGHSFGNTVKLNSGGHVQALETSQFVTGTISSAISGTGDLTVNAPSSMVILTGNSSYSSGTTVSAGTLVVNNTSGSGTGTNTVTVDSGATLGGSGKITGAIDLDQGAILEPGINSPNVPGTTLTAGSLLWDPGTKLTLQLGSSAQDKLVLNGALTKETAGSGNYSIGIDDDGGIPLGDYTLATFTSTTFTASDFTLDLPGNYTGTLSIINGKDLVLDLTSGSGQFPQNETAAVTTPSDLVPTPTGDSSSSFTPSEILQPTPEPTSAFLLAFGGATLLAWRRRR
jgi:autotransporter-associated beta strand protein